MAGTKAGAAKRRAALSTDSTTVERVALPSAAIYECGKKPLKFGDLTLSQGDPIPGAENWMRVESWVRSGRIVKR